MHRVPVAVAGVDERWGHLPERNPECAFLHNGIPTVLLLPDRLCGPRCSDTRFSAILVPSHTKNGASARYPYIPIPRGSRVAFWTSAKTLPSKPFSTPSTPRMSRQRLRCRALWTIVSKASAWHKRLVLVPQRHWHAEPTRMAQPAGHFPGKHTKNGERWIRDLPALDPRASCFLGWRGSGVMGLTVLVPRVLLQSRTVTL